MLSDRQIADRAKRSLARARIVEHPDRLADAGADAYYLAEAYLVAKQRLEIANRKIQTIQNAVRNILS